MEKAPSWRKAILPLGIVLFLEVGLLLRLYTAPVMVIEGPTELLYEPDPIYVSGNVLATLQTGERGKLLWIRYSKDTKFYKIYLRGGRFGYVMDGSNFRLVPPNTGKD